MKMLHAKDLQALGRRTRDLAEGTAYAAQQVARVSRYLGQAVTGNLVFGRRPAPGDRTNLPSPAVVLGDLQRLFERDWQNIQAGLYKKPSDTSDSPLDFSLRSWRVFRDLFRVRARQRRKAVQEFSPGVPSEEFPTYYAQTFHFQTDGYLSEASADLYDHQVELVFGGGADAMRRQALVPIVHFIRNKGSSRQLSLLDVACGTGRFLASLKANEPELHVTGLDLSPWYLKKARERLKSNTRADFVEANAENIPFRDESFDLVTCIYLFHELPRRVRSRVAAEMARVLKPGGLLVFEDSIQLGDKPSFDESLRQFPKGYHEPYYLDFIEQDLDALFREAGLEHADSPDLAFFSKILCYRKAE